MQENQDLQLEIKVNNEPIPLNPFVQDVVKNVVLSLITSLKLKTEPEKIELTLKKQ